MGTNKTPPALSKKAILCPGRKDMRSRTAFGIVIWYFEESIAEAVIDL
jgi:hypothetical protein